MRIIMSSYLWPLLKTEGKTGQRGYGLVLEGIGASYLGNLLTLKYLRVGKSEQQVELKKILSEQEMF